MKKVVDNVYVVKPFDPKAVDCCVYLIDTKSDDGLILVDAGITFEQIQDIEKDGFNLADIKHCLITHGHLDHFGVCFRLKEFNKDIKFYAHELDAERIEQKLTGPFPNQFYANYKYEPVKVTHRITIDNEILKFGQLEVKCIHIPGHTPGSIAYISEISEKKILFAGDIPGIAINIGDGNLNQYINSMEKILKFAVDILCEGHEEVSQPAEKVRKFIKGYLEFNKKLNSIVLETPKDTEVLLSLAILSDELGWYSSVVDFCNYLLEIDPQNSEAKRLLEKMKELNPPKIEFVKRLIEENYKGDN
ncbi:MAG: MBL fold metallo-hydrolase [Candidatus Lokiarchaeota archaeon]|nr:MBL fold metallo-hydrolase [Candidatus Lokiarchaeota archaeon]